MKFQAAVVKGPDDPVLVPLYILFLLFIKKECNRFKVEGLENFMFLN